MSNFESNYNKDLERNNSRIQVEKTQSRDYATGQRYLSSEEKQDFKRTVKDLKKALKDAGSKKFKKVLQAEIEAIMIQIPGKQGAAETGKLLSNMNDNLSDKDRNKLEETFIAMSIATENKVLKESLSNILEMLNRENPFQSISLSDSELDHDTSSASKSNYEHNIEQAGESSTEYQKLEEYSERNKQKIEGSSKQEINAIENTFLLEYAEEAIESRGNTLVMFEGSIKRGPESKHGNMNEKGIYFKYKDTDFIVYIPKLNKQETKIARINEQVYNIMNKAYPNSVSSSKALQIAISEVWRENVNRYTIDDWKAFKVVR